MPEHAQEVAAGERFEFGKNWSKYLRVVDPMRIERAEASLASMLPWPRLDGKTFLDVGSGSGLFSLAARRLGARVVSIDYDPDSVRATKTLRQRFLPDDANWSVREGSVLDIELLRSIGPCDVAYAWGVLHHTGAMWNALANVAEMVVPGGVLFIAIYNDQGAKSRFWLRVKRAYGRLPGALRWPFLFAVMGVFESRLAFLRLLRRENPLPWKHWDGARGMSWFRDWVDWVGGYPFEVAKPKAIADFYAARGFTLLKSKTASSLGCNEFVFARS
jgi:SAM-dependent methyltransferase